MLAKWLQTPVATIQDGDTTISILDVIDVIDEDFWSGDGVTANRISAAVRSIGNRDVTVRINSPGGDMFEGIAIYNLLRSHPAKVTVEVLGWAASTASIIAMAGDDIRMGLGSFMMVHNAWGMVVGNRHDMREAASHLIALVEVREQLPPWPLKVERQENKRHLVCVVIIRPFRAPTEECLNLGHLDLAVAVLIHRFEDSTMEVLDLGQRQRAVAVAVNDCEHHSHASSMHHGRPHFTAAIILPAAAAPLGSMVAPLHLRMFVIIAGTFTQ